MWRALAFPLAFHLAFAAALCSRPCHLTLAWNCRAVVRRDALGGKRDSSLYPVLLARLALSITQVTGSKGEDYSVLLAR